MAIRRIHFGLALLATSAAAVFVPVLIELIWGERNCAVEYCGPLWLFLLWPLFAAAIGGAIVGSMTSRAWKRSIVAPFLVSLSVLIPMGILLLVDLYAGEWRPNVEGDAAFGFAFAAPIYLVVCWVAAASVQITIRWWVRDRADGWTP